MTWDPADYVTRRNYLAAGSRAIIDTEKATASVLVEILLREAEAIEEAFNHASRVIPQWINYAPEQRGRGPKGTAAPWLEVAEYAVGSILLVAIHADIPDISFPSLPMGGDIRFATNSEFVHIDLKATGPNDSADEAVVPPFQVSGDGALTDATGVKNNLLQVHGKRADSEFQPALPPFYLLDDATRLTQTFFLKVNYDVLSYGDQPLRDMELACLPNGLLLFDGPRYCVHDGLFTPGKDDKSKAISKRRVRVKFDGLSTIDSWRSVKIQKLNGTWVTAPRRVT